MATKDQIETVAKHFVIACIWADCEEGTHPRATKEAMATAYTECEKFIDKCGELFTLAMERYQYGYGRHPDAGSAEAAFGHDFYLTRQGHGVGFWDRDELKTDPAGTGDHDWRDIGKELADLCHYNEIDVEFYRGWLYLRPRPI